MLRAAWLVLAAQLHGTIFGCSPAMRVCIQPWRWDAGVLGTAGFTPGLRERAGAAVDSDLPGSVLSHITLSSKECYVNVRGKQADFSLFSSAVEKSNKPAHSITMLKNHLSLSRPTASKRDGNCLVASRAHHGLVQQADLITALACPHGQ